MCIVDHADRAAIGDLWADLILGFALDIARDLPLVLVLGVHGPRGLGEYQDDEPASVSVARQLNEAGIAIWHPLLPVDVAALRRWTGPATHEALTTVLSITGGRASWTAQLWREWQRRGVIEDVAENRWRFATGRERHLDEVEDLLRERLKVLTGKPNLNALAVLAHAHRLLLYAALEGRRFTPAAVAHALRRDTDDIIDFLDERPLALDAEHSDGLVVDDGWVAVSDEAGERHIAVYRFARELDWLTLRHRGLTDAELRTVSRDLADALAAEYGGQAHRVAHTLTRLYEIAEQTDEARHYRRMADSGVSRDLLLQRARRILGSPDPKNRAERRRASQTLMEAALALYHSGPFPEGLAYAQAGHRLAVLDADRAECMRLMGVHLKHLGDPEQALGHFNRAIELYRELGDRRGEVRSRHSLAVLQIELDEHGAHAEFTRILRLYQELHEPFGEAGARFNLGIISLVLQEHEQARTQLTLAIELSRKVSDRRGEAVALDGMASLATLENDLEQARQHHSHALNIYRELRDEVGEGHVLVHLAVITDGQGNAEKARQQLLRAAALFRKNGDAAGEAGARDVLASLDGDTAD